jgi:hypothetical protein
MMNPFQLAEVMNPLEQAKITNLLQLAEAMNPLDQTEVTNLQVDRTPPSNHQRGCHQHGYRRVVG